MAVAHLFGGCFDTASAWAEKSFRHLPSFLMVVGYHRGEPCACGPKGRSAASDESLARELDPTLRVSNLADRPPVRRPEDLATFADGLRKAGLPTERHRPRAEMSLVCLSRHPPCSLGGRLTSKGAGAGRWKAVRSLLA